MKKIISLSLTLIMLFSLISFALPTGLAASEYTYGDYTFTVSGSNATIISYPETATGTVNIPSKFNSYTVTAIAAYAFYACTLLTEVKIPNTVKSIGNYAFGYCTSLVSVDIPSSVTSIGANAFKNSNKVSFVCEPGSYAEQYAKDKGISISEQKGSIRFAQNEYHGFIGVKFPISGTYTSDGNVQDLSFSWAVDGGTTESLLNLPASVVNDPFKKEYYFSVIAKFTNAGSFNVTITAPDGATATCRVFVSSDAAYPDGYSFETDRYNFENINERIEKKYYTNMFLHGKNNTSENSQIVDTLYNEREKQKHGHCFGMAISTASTLYNCPYISDYLLTSGSKLKDISKGSLNTDLDMSCKDFIKYCHIYQYSADVANQRNDPSHQGIENVFDAIAESVLEGEGGTGIAVDLFSGYNTGSTKNDVNHTVYATGIENGDILVNDSNAPKKQQRINISGSNWSYSCGGWTWDNNHSSINYVDDAIMVYFLNFVGEIGDTSISTSDLKKLQENELLNTSGSLVSSDKGIVLNNYANKILETDGLDNDSHDLYWISNKNTISAENRDLSNGEIKLIDHKKSIAVQLPKNSKAEINVNDSAKENFAFVEAPLSERTVFTCSYVENNNYRTITIEGNAASKDLVVKERDNRFEIEGFKTIQISSSINDQIVSASTIDSNSENKAIVYMDDQCHIVAEGIELNDDACPQCGQVHTGFFGAIIGFFHKLIYRLTHLFG